MNSFFDKLYDALRSIKLAVALLVLLALFAVAGGIVPQGMATDFYLTQFPGAAGRAILALGLNRVFSGIAFLIVAAVFAMNLTVCTLHRLANEFAKPFRKRRHGPDLLHLGLIILLFGGIMTARTRTESTINLRKGDTADLPDGSKLVLADLVYEEYPDGRPKSWESIVVINRGPATGLVQRRIKVNAPLRGRGFSVYQQNWHAEQQAGLSDAMGIRTTLDPGARALFDGGFALFMATGQAAAAGSGPASAGSAPAALGAPDDAIFLLEKGGMRTVVRAAPGEAVGPFTFTGFSDQSVSGLAIVTDKGYPYVAAGFVLVILGVFITYIRKLKGMLA